MNAEGENFPGEEPGRLRSGSIFIPWRKVARRTLAILLLVGGIVLILRYFIHAT